MSASHDPGFGEAPLPLARSLDPKGDPAATIAAICEASPEAWTGMRDTLREHGAELERSGRYRSHGAGLLDFAFDRLALDAADERTARARVGLLLGLLAFSKTSDPAWVGAVFERLVLPWMKEALERGYYDVALDLEFLAYGQFVKQTETEEHFRRCFGRWTGDMVAAGRRLRAELAPRDAAPPTRSPLVVGFFLHTASRLAHVEVLLNMLEGLAQLSPAPFRARVYVFSGVDEGLQRRLSAIGVAAVFLDRECQAAGDSICKRLVHLKERLARDGVTALVWVSVAGMMPFAFALRIAPVQIWWAMKYHSLDFAEIDGYVTNNSVEPYKRIGGRLWRAGRGASVDLYDASLQEEAARIRSAYGPAVKHVLGCLGREEKLDHPVFIETVIEILKAHPDAAFLWTGRVRLPAIQRRFDAAGVSARCFFIGWVDTRLYAQVIDVFLDSFPFPCGLTLLQAMAAGKPFVCHVSEESKETGAHGLIHALLREGKGTEAERRAAEEAFAGGRLYLCASNAAQYREHAERLLGDAQLRSEAGAGAARFARSFFADRRASAAGFARHFVEIVEEKLAQ